MNPLSRTAAVLRKALLGSRALGWLSAVMAAVLVVAALGLVVDDRTVGGQPVWLKPAKFAVSIAVYGLTLAWLLGHLRRGHRAARWATCVIVVMALLEVGIIVLQAARGRASHYNEATPLDEALWRAMGMTIVVLWVATVVLTVLLWRDGMPDRASAWAVRLGMLLLLLGLLQGFTMVVPTAEQLALDEQGVETLMGAHAVGVSDGGPGMPLTGWSTTGGDLRIGHFVGIHGLQAVLLFAMLLPTLVADVARRTRLVFVFSFGYAGLLVLVTCQALRGQPLLAPDALTLVVAGGLLVATAAAGLVAWRPRARVSG
ncbi:hypothetical protein [Catellatospora citrea]|uniref:Uncharacterized protein n=1 Tax=Catellatospora citrea TaxID=53366 RepID=A0A8J3KB31_9ACTN|nr:hypothetical protein [Catellatospora citrea]RKE12961.1 hypothetical protein C8E86_7906 [Catellatospora citrea]GIF95798.1 hypothetical protein Cci01nite_08920 [Catellatospora citrea]